MFYTYDKTMYFGSHAHGYEFEKPMFFLTSRISKLDSLHKCPRKHSDIFRPRAADSG